MSDFETMQALFRKVGIEFGTSSAKWKWDGRLYHYSLGLDAGKGDSDGGVTFAFDENKNLVAHACWGHDVRT